VSIDLEFTDETGVRIVRRELDRDRSELLQHEVDHLDGILAVDRMTEPGALVLRDVYLARRRELDAQVADE
jgi:peptide deformylase